MLTLTDNERAVLERASAGDTYARIALDLGFTEKSVSKMALRMCRKLGARNITHAVFIACRTGLLVLEAPSTRDREVPAGPGIRLIRSLVAEGFSVVFIAERMGMGQPELCVLMQRTHITPAMNDRMRLVFGDLAGKDPLQLGVHVRGYTRSRNRARAAGWAIVPREELNTVCATLLQAA
ncbi:helix-turn-helix transcriptional regulator [Streptomyces xanthochromogenes]|uniref:helix-turn-helix domain-containing protein n=1 Tax=Streptomyces xanthochromogenes TaxID=67384 RepID=UPI0034214B9E